MLMLFVASAWAQQQAPAPGTMQPKKKPPGELRGKPEKLSCTLGTEDRHARIAVELIGGRVRSVAYYSKWKPRTCSMHIARNDAWSQWQDTGSVTVVTLNEAKGAFLIDHEPRFVKFLFREIDRERFCGMQGKITGSLTVTRGKSQCELEGIMDEESDLFRESPKTEIQKTEVPKTEIPGAEAPKTEVPKTEVPKTEAPKTEVPKMEAPKTS